MLLTVLVVLSVLLAALLLFTQKQPEAPVETVPATVEATQPPTEAPTTQPATLPTEPPTTEPSTEPPTEPPTQPQQPDELTRLLEEGGVSYEVLAQDGCTQLVSVVSDGTKAKIRFFSCEEGAWEERTELSCRGRVGRNGVGFQKREGDGCTPSGLYGIGSAFYIKSQPETGLDSFQITKDTYWVDDPESEFYNQRVEGTANKDWNSAEHMIGYDVYRYGFVVDYNLQAVKYAGSAIFFHVGDNPTAGCVATGENMVLAYLKELDKERNPHILILSGD